MPVPPGWAVPVRVGGVALEKVTLTVLPRLLPLLPSLKVTVAPELAARLRPAAAVTVRVKLPPVPLVRLSAELPLAAVMEVMLSVVGVLAVGLPTMAKLPPFRIIWRPASRRLFLLPLT